MAFLTFFFLKKFEKVEKTGIISTKFSLRCTPSVILGANVLSYLSTNVLTFKYLKVHQSDFITSTYIFLLNQERFENFFLPKQQKTLCSNYPPQTADDDYVCKANAQKFLRVSKDQINTESIQKILEHLRHGTSAQFVRDIHNVSSNFLSNTFRFLSRRYKAFA